MGDFQNLLMARFLVGFLSYTEDHYFEVILLKLLSPTLGRDTLVIGPSSKCFQSLVFVKENVFQSLIFGAYSPNIP